MVPFSPRYVIYNVYIIMQPVRVLTKKHIAATNISMLYRNKRKADRIVILQLVYTNAFSSR